MDNETLGKNLKKLAKAKGNFVEVNIQNIFNILDVLSYFFYRKKHEWIAICFIDENFICKVIWFNKGYSHQGAQVDLSPEGAVKRSKIHNIKYIILSHNHPVSSFDTPDYGSRRLNIDASYEIKNRLLGLSDKDILLGTRWHEILDFAGIGYANAVFVAGNFEISGNSELVANFTKNKTAQGCLISTYLFGFHSSETFKLRKFRDDFLIKKYYGKKFCTFYYSIAPSIIKYIDKKIIKMCLKLFIGAIVRIIPLKY